MKTESDNPLFSELLFACNDVLAMLESPSFSEFIATHRMRDGYWAMCGAIQLRKQTLRAAISNAIGDAGCDTCGTANRQPGRLLCVDCENDALRAQVEREMPRPLGGFENCEQEDEWREAQERRFMELVHK